MTKIVFLQKNEDEIPLQSTCYKMFTSYFIPQFIPPFSSNMTKIVFLQKNENELAL